MCNLYSVTSNQEAIRDWARVMNDSTGNLPPMPGVFPDYAAPIVRNQPEGRELASVRWGMPTPPKYLVGKKTDPGVTNIRNVNSAHWRRWLGIENRCVVPFTSFSENEALPDGTRPPIWFALNETRPLAFFAGIWTPKWTSVRKLKEGEVTTDLFGFLTTEPNSLIAPIHNRMLVVLDKADWPVWLGEQPGDPTLLLRPPPADVLQCRPLGEREARSQRSLL